jgi:hypothetical protein
LDFCFAFHGLLFCKLKRQWLQTDIILFVAILGVLLNDLHCFNSTTMSWIMYSDAGLEGAPNPRMAPGFSSLDGKLYVYGGQTTAGE